MSADVTGRSSATSRAARLLTIVPWIASQDGPTVDEVCHRFGLGRDQVLHDLEVLQFVGVPPYTPDTLIEVVVEGDRIWMRFADMFSRPFRLTPRQAVALIVAGRARPEVTGGGATDDPLRRALRKVADVVDIRPEEAVAVDLGTVSPEVFETVRAAVTDRCRVRLGYYTYSRDTHTTREVDPHRVFAREGAWYLQGFCHTTEVDRLFRLDRVSAVERLDLAVTTSPPDAGDRALFTPDKSTPRVTLDLDPEATWVADYYPTEEVTETEGGGVRVRLAVSGRAWLERLLLQLGPSGRVVRSTDPALATADRGAARRILARYGRR